MGLLSQLVTNIGALGYSINAISYLLLALLLLISWKKKFLGGLLLAAVVIQVIWAVLIVYHLFVHPLPEYVLLISEDVRLIAWVVFLLEIIRHGTESGKNRKYFLFTYGAISIAFVITLVFEYLGNIQLLVANHFYTYIYDLLLATFGLLLTEHFYRNSKQDKRWSIKFLCIGIGMLFAYDLYMYSHATLFEGINASLWNARGFVNVVIVPLFAISAARNPNWSFNVFVSRQIVFYSSGLFAIGIYLTIMAVGGYYVKIYGGIWGREAQIIFLAGAIVILFVILSSGALRAKIKIFLNKHFYENKYDYREEWMGFIQKLAHIESPKYLKEQILQTVAMIMHSRGALLYLKNEDAYRCIAAWNADATDISFDDQSPLVNFLNNREWIIDLHELKDRPQNYPELQIPDDLLSAQSWLIIPLKHYYDLIGFIVLLEPFVKVNINWEDRDLLKAIGKQVSSYVAFMIATETLAEAEKFSAFNRLSAYVVHDMKNSVAQLDLIVKNAEKHQENQEFIADSFLTVANVVDRMKRMLNQLKRIDLQKMDAKRVDVGHVLKTVVKKCSDRLPQPTLMSDNDSVFIFTEADRFMNVLEHLVTNAQDATDDEGKIIIRSFRQDKDILIEIEDTGSGMSQDFITNHLFKPFDTTKGNAGMGVGVFEAKEFVKYYGGQLNVQSKPGIGTMFTITLPVYNEEISFEPKFG